MCSDGWPAMIEFFGTHPVVVVEMAHATTHDAKVAVTMPSRATPPSINALAKVSLPQQARLLRRPG
jgi:hypothetical protein